MAKTVNIELTTEEVKKLLTALQSEISHELEILQDNDYEPSGETFVVFLESVKDVTDIYIKLNSVIEE